VGDRVAAVLSGGNMPAWSLLPLLLLQACSEAHVLPGQPCGQLARWPFETNWKKLGRGGVYMDVDTETCGFKLLPSYVATFVGINDCLATQRGALFVRGTSSVTSPTNSSFRVGDSGQ
jgi:hypothetical protein